MNNRITIPDAVRQMLCIVHRLQRDYPKKRFTLDGRLVGDIGEMLVEEAYDITLFDKVRKDHDGVSSDGRFVQIKSTMNDSLTFPADHIPQCYIGIKILHPDGSFREVFNGLGSTAWEAVKDRKTPKTHLFSIGIRRLSLLNATVKLKDRIPRRSCVSSYGIGKQDGD